MNHASFFVDHIQHFVKYCYPLGFHVLHLGILRQKMLLFSQLSVAVFEAVILFEIILIPL